MTEFQEEYISRIEAAAFCKERGYPVSKATLGKLASTGGGPKYKKFGAGRNARVLYTKPDLLTWIQSKLTDPLPSSSAAA